MGNKYYNLANIGRPQEDKGDKMVDSYHELKSLRAVAKHFNCSIGNVRFCLKRRGVVMNPRGRKSAWEKVEG